MPNTSLNEAIKEAYASAPTHIVTLETLVVSHPDLDESIYMVRDRVGHTFTLEDGTERFFEPIPFRVALPPSGANGIQSLNIAIDNIDRRISDFLMTVINSGKPVELTYRPYLDNDPTTPQLNPPLVLFLLDVAVTASEISGNATFADVVNKEFPNEYYTRARFPSLGN